MSYRFTLKDNKLNAYRNLTWFFFFLHFMAASILSLNTTDRNVKAALYIAGAVFLLAFLLFYLFRHKKKTWQTFAFAMAVLYAVFWLWHAGVIALVIFLAVYSFVSLVQQKKNTASFSSSGIALKTVFKTKACTWQQIDHVVLKDNLLTIDFKSNRIIQAELEQEVADEESFNRFCREQLHNKA